MDPFEGISTDGGPIIIGDAGLVSLWEVAEDGRDYFTVCDGFDAVECDGQEVLLGRGMVLAWNTIAAGSARVLRDGGRIVLISPWSDALRMDDVLGDGVSVESGILKVSSGKLIVLWAAESGNCLRSNGENILIDAENLSVAGTVCVLDVEKSSVPYRLDQLDHFGVVVKRCVLG